MSIRFLLDENIPLTNTRTYHLLKVMENFLEHHKDKLQSKHLIIVEDDRVKVY